LLAFTFSTWLLDFLCGFLQNELMLIKTQWNDYLMKCNENLCTSLEAIALDGSVNAYMFTCIDERYVLENAP